MPPSKYEKLARRMKQMVDEIDDCLDHADLLFEPIQMQYYAKMLAVERSEMKDKAFLAMVKTHAIGLKNYSLDPRVKREYMAKPWLAAVLIRAFYMNAQCVCSIKDSILTEKRITSWKARILLPKDSKENSERARKRAILYCPIYNEISDEIELFEDEDRTNSITYHLFQVGQYYEEQKLLEKNLAKEAYPEFKKLVVAWHKDKTLDLLKPKKIDGTLTAGFAPKDNESLAIAYEKVKKAIREKKFRNYGPLLPQWLDRLKELIFDKLPWPDARKTAFLQEWEQNIFGNKKRAPAKGKGMGRWKKGMSIDDELASRFIRYFVDEFISDPTKKHLGEIACILWIAVWSSISGKGPAATIKNIIELKLKHLNLTGLEIRLEDTTIEISAGLAALLEILAKSKRPNNYIFEVTLVDRLEDALKRASKILLAEGKPEVLPEAFLTFPHPYRGVRIPKKQRQVMKASKHMEIPKLYPSGADIIEAITCNPSA